MRARLKLIPKSRWHATWINLFRIYRGKEGTTRPVTRAHTHTHIYIYSHLEATHELRLVSLYFLLLVSWETSLGVYVSHQTNTLLYTHWIHIIYSLPGSMVPARNAVDRKTIGCVQILVANFLCKKSIKIRDLKNINWLDNCFFHRLHLVELDLMKNNTQIQQSVPRTLIFHFHYMHFMRLTNKKKTQLAKSLALKPSFPQMFQSMWTLITSLCHYSSHLRAHTNPARPTLKMTQLIRRRNLQYRK